MSIVDAVVECRLHESFRVQQVRGMFDLPASDMARAEFSVEVPGVDEAWEIGLIVGPSGSGKSTVARAAFGEAIYSAGEWAGDRAVIDGFGERSIKEVTAMLTSVGFSSPPAWLKPYAVLSNGEKFRCDLARALLGSDGLVVFDEFTSVVDRTAAKIGSSAVAKAIRNGRAGAGKRLVAVACHYDIAEWLEPDWVVDMASGTLARGRLRRPGIELEIAAVDSSAWGLFKRHHYLDGKLNPFSQCFMGTIDGCPAAFTAVLWFPHPYRPAWREHRTVCLPDFQGVGIGNAMSEFIASIFRATGWPYFSTTGHPAMMKYRARSGKWEMHRGPGRAGVSQGGVRGLARRATERVTCGFEYVGMVRGEEARGFGLSLKRLS